MKGRPNLNINSDWQLNNCSNVNSVAKSPLKLNIIANISVRDIREIDFI